MKKLTKSRDMVNKWLERLEIYKNGVFNKKLFSFDSIQRIISKEDWAYLEKSLIQKVNALNKFLFDIYHDKQIIKSVVIPQKFVYSSKEE